MQISELVRDRLGLKYMDDDLMALDGLTSEMIKLHSFHKDAEWFRGQTATYLLTRYLLPVADLAELTVGLHLLPSYVAQGRFAMAQFDPESDLLIDHAHSVRAYVHRELLVARAEGEDVDEELRVARELFGEDFYREEHGPASFEHLERAMIDKYGGAAADYKELADMAALRKSTDERIYWLKRGAEAVPECMYFHRELARLYRQRGESTAAAQSFAHSLDCYHHTGYGLRPEGYYALGRELLEEVPSAFPYAARLDLTLDDGEARMWWIVSLFQAGKAELSVKLLSDFRYDSRTDLHPVLFEFLRLHYEELGWEWALAWSDLCAVDDDESRQYWYRGQPLSANWDRPVRDFLGLS